jgi:uncharacterized beta-barrel protein YwiB (DUF1934 family)
MKNKKLLKDIKYPLVFNMMKDFIKINKRFEKSKVVELTRINKEKEKQRQYRINIDSNLKKYHKYTFYIKGKFEEKNSKKHMTHLKRKLNREIWSIVYNKDNDLLIGKNRFVKIKLETIDKNSIATYSCYFTKILKNEDMKEIGSYLESHFSDGWGEGFEQQPFFVDHKKREHFFSLIDLDDRIPFHYE